MIHVSAMSQRLSAPGISLLLGHGPSSPCGCLGCQGRNSSRREAIQCLNNDAVYMSVNRSLYRAMLELRGRPVSAGSRGGDERPSKFRGCLHQGDAVIVAPAGLYALDGPAHPRKRGVQRSIDFTISRSLHFNQGHSRLEFTEASIYVQSSASSP